MKTLPLTILLFSSICIIQALSGVEPWVVVTGRGDGNLDGAPASYTVPAGKVFIVDSVQYRSVGAVADGEAFHVATYRNLGNYSARRTVYIELLDYKRSKVFPLPVPIQLKAGDGVGSNQISGYTYWFGKLVDEGELFAKLDVELEGSGVDNTSMTAKARVSPIRPYRLTVESTTDLNGTFTIDPNGTTASTGEKMVKDIAVDKGVDLKFVRAVALARPNP